MKCPHCGKSIAIKVMMDQIAKFPKLEASVRGLFARLDKQRDKDQDKQRDKDQD